MRLLKTSKSLKSKLEKDNFFPSVYDIEINDLSNQPMRLKDFEGKYLLFVNVASKCGFTSQYKELQKLSEMYKHTLVIIGVPCNQFGHQEPGEPIEISSFCEINYGVTFPITEKIKVKGTHQHPLYQWLTKKSLNGKASSSVKWNFQKYLIDKNGKLIDFYYSLTTPLSKKITKHLK